MTLLTRDGTLFERLKPMTLAQALRTRESIRPLATIQREAIESALILCEGDRDEAARRLGIGRNTIFRKIKEFRGT